MRHNLALYEALRGVDGPRLAADVVCGGGPRAVHSPITADYGSTAPAGHVAHAATQAFPVAARSDAWRISESGAVHVVKTGRVRAPKAEPAVATADLLGDAQVKDDSPAETSVVSYTVRQGDTLSLIAKKYYGNGRKYTALLQANSSRLAHPDKIYPGMVVNIPALG